MTLSGVRGEEGAGSGICRRRGCWLGAHSVYLPGAGGGGVFKARALERASLRTSASRPRDYLCGPICVSESHGLRRVLRKH